MKTAGNAILLRMRQEETYRDFVRQLLSVGVLYLHRWSLRISEGERQSR